MCRTLPDRGAWGHLGCAHPSAASSAHRKPRLPQEESGCGRSVRRPGGGGSRSRGTKVANRVGDGGCVDVERCGTHRVDRCVPPSAGRPRLRRRPRRTCRPAGGSDRSWSVRGSRDGGAWVGGVPTGRSMKCGGRAPSGGQSGWSTVLCRPGRAGPSMPWSAAVRRVPSCREGTAARSCWWWTECHARLRGAANPGPGGTPRRVRRRGRVDDVADASGAGRHDDHPAGEEHGVPGARPGAARRERRRTRPQQDRLADGVEAGETDPAGRRLYVERRKGRTAGADRRPPTADG